MTDKTSLGDRMKKYEQPYRFILPRRTYTILRVDGRAFHTLLRGAEKPYDSGFMAAMDDVAEGLCAGIQGAKFSYAQSDEVSVLYTDFDSLTSEPWFGGVLAKQLSVSASIATMKFNSSTKWVGNRGRAQFDARVFTMSDPVEVANYFLWRQQDATRNSIAMAAQAKFSHKELHGVNTDQMQEMLWSEHKINWNDYPEGFKRGRVVTKKYDNECSRMIYHWLAEPAPIFNSLPDSFLAAAIPPLPSLSE